MIREYQFPAPAPQVKSVQITSGRRTFGHAEDRNLARKRRRRANGFLSCMTCTTRFSYTTYTYIYYYYVYYTMRKTHTLVQVLYIINNNTYYYHYCFHFYLSCCSFRYIYSLPSHNNKCYILILFMIEYALRSNRTFPSNFYIYILIYRRKAFTYYMI